LKHPFIVSKNLPKKDIKNELCREKDGILLAHPNIITELARIIRKMIIGISKESATKQNRETKQTRIYALVNSREFRRYIESIEDVHKKLSDHQNDGRRYHEKSWKKESILLEKLMDAVVDITTGIDTIIDGDNQTELQDLDTEHTKDLDRVESGDEDLHQP